MQQLTKAFEGHEIRTVTYKGRPAVVACDVAKTIGYSRNADFTSLIPDKYKGAQKVDTPGGQQEVICATYNGVIGALRDCRKLKAKELLEELGHPIEYCVLTSIQASVTHRVKQTFSSHRIRAEKQIGVYRADMVFPDFDLVVEVDEHGHKDRNQLYEAQRDAFMQGSGYTVIRYNPDSEPIEALYASIHEHIFNYQ